MKKNAVYICTKPLQYFNCLNLSTTVDRSKVKLTLILIPNFSNSVHVISKIKRLDKNWDEILEFDTKERAISYLSNIKVEEVYVDNDLHSEGVLLWKLGANIDFYVYEEGVGSYRRFISNVTKSKIKNALIYVLGKLKLFNSIHGAGKYTKGIFLYNKKAYDSIHPALSYKSKEFFRDFISNYESNKGTLEEIFEINKLNLPSRKKVAVFLTSNNRSIDFEAEFLNSVNSNNYDLTIFKSHPNVSDLYGHLNNVITQNVLAEFIILKLLANANQVTIYHYNCSTVMYLLKYGTSEVNLSKENDEFTRICNLWK